MKFVKSLLFTFVLVIFCQLTHGLTEGPIESERQLKRMIQLVSSLMQRFGFSDGILFTSGHVTAKRDRRQTYTGYPNSKNVRYLDNVIIELHDYGDEFNGKIHYREDSGGYGGGYGGNSGYNGYSKSGCGSDSYYLVPLLALTAMSVILAYLLALATTTTTASTTTMMMGRRRRENVYSSTEIELLDAPTWLSMVQEMWDEDRTLAENGLSCSQRRLCFMNSLARKAPEKAGHAVSFSSLPLSYLLHHRHQGGFTNYLEASFMGMTGANCSMIYSECPRLL